MLDTAHIRKCIPAELRDYYVDLLKQKNVENITSQLLQAVDKGLLPPLTFAPWLGVSKSPVVIREALKQDTSIKVRDLAIRRLAKDLYSPNWREIWDGLGGVAGIIDIFSTLSVKEVQKACKAIGRCAKGENPFEKRECITDLFKGLQPILFPAAKDKTTDSRPLGQYYIFLLPSCSRELIESAISGDLWGIWHLEYIPSLLRFHSESMRREQLQSLHGGCSEFILEHLLQRCPPTTAHEPGFSSSMEFSLTVLRELAESTSSSINDKFFIKSLVQPLLSRLIRKRVKSIKAKEVVDLMMQYLKTHPTAGTEITNNPWDVRHVVAEYWSRKPERFERQLRLLCSHPVFGTTAIDHIDSWQEFLVNIPKSRRYPLLRLLYQESTGLDIDLDEDLKKVKGILHPDMLHALSKEQALSLFTRLRMVRGDESLVGIGRPGFAGSDHYFTLPSDYEMAYGDPDLCYIALQGQNGNEKEAERLAISYIELRKKKSQSSSQPEQRGFYAKSVLWAAVASGSLTQLESVLEWMKRFLRDPLALKGLYNFPTKISRLLSGAPEPLSISLSTSPSASDVHERVKKANAVLESMFDTACTALQEPSFNESYWKNLVNLFYSVIEERLYLSLELKNILNVSDDEVYQIIWESTIQMLISVETKANQEGHERLNVNHIRGILGSSMSWDVGIQPKASSVVMFFDNLAKARDDLWRTLRLGVYPATAALPVCYPRGLGIQYLTSPWILDVQDLGALAPYLASRVKNCLFPDPAASLQPVPTDEETQKAVGPFVDSYHRAIRLYIPKSCDNSEKKRRAQEIWNYAMEQLSKGRMSDGEAVRFWSPQVRNYLDEWRPEGYTPLKSYEWPLVLIPEVEDPSEPSEWDPFSSGRPDLPARSLGKPTYLDLSLLGERGGNLNIRNTITLPEPEVPAHKVFKAEIWYQCSEGGALAALLYLDTKFRSKNERPLDSRLLASEKDFRYPRLFLDDEFLLSDHLRPLEAVNSIRVHVDLIPPGLLSQLAINVMQALQDTDPKSSNFADLQQTAYILVKALGESDKPSLASEMTISIILDKPKSSSWHRQLLKPGFLRRLSANEAREMFQHFANEILDRLQARKNSGQKSYVASTGAQLASTQDGKDNSQSKPFIKFTTLKLLAQLLQDSEIVTMDFTLSILQKLFQHATHIDVRLAIVKVLISMLESCKADRINDIITALEPIVPIAGSLNERQPFNEGDWAHAEENLVLPELQDVSISTTNSPSPILAALFNYYKGSSEDSNKLNPFVEKILIPTLGNLKEQTAKWAALFLKKYRPGDMSEKEIVLPALPRSGIVFEICFSTNSKRACYLPSTLLEEYMDYVVFNIARPPALRKFNKKFDDDSRLKSQPEVRTWLNLYNRSISGNSTFDLFKLLNLASGEITPEIVKQQVLRHFTALIWNDAPLHVYLTSTLKESLSRQHLEAPWWKPHGQPILEAMLTSVDQIRSNDWQQDPKRNPTLLPDTFPWRLRLLDYPWANLEDNMEDRERKCMHFASQIIEVINERVNTLGYNWFNHLKAYLNLEWSWSGGYRQVGRSSNKRADPRKLAFEENRLLSALFISDTVDLPSKPATPMGGLLSVEIASHLVLIAEEWDDLDKNLLVRVKKMIEKWKVKESEEIRRIGYNLEKGTPKIGLSRE